MAVTSSITVSLGLRKMLGGMTKTMTGASLVMFNCAIAYFGVAVAGYLNSYCMRMGEMEKGIIVYDEETGEEMGISKVAARKAVLDTA